MSKLFVDFPVVKPDRNRMVEVQVGKLEDLQAANVRLQDEVKQYSLIMDLQKATLKRLLIILHDVVKFARVWNKPELGSPAEYVLKIPVFTVNEWAKILEEYKEILG